jgi:hypothetical protein
VSRPRRIPHGKLSVEDLAGAVRARVGAVFRMADLALFVSHWPAPVLIVDRLVKAGLATRSITADAGKGRVLVTLAALAREVKPAKKKRIRRLYWAKTAVTFVVGMPARACGSTRKPLPGKVAFVDLDRTSTKVRYIGQTPDGWLVAHYGDPSWKPLTGSASSDSSKKPSSPRRLFGPKTRSRRTRKTS